jgi:RNA polymerase sigma factor (sigma-70 family)
MPSGEEPLLRFWVLDSCRNVPSVKNTEVLMRKQLRSARAKNPNRGSPLEVAESLVRDILRERDLAEEAELLGQQERQARHRQRGLALFDTLWLLVVDTLVMPLAERFRFTARQAGLEPEDLAQESYFKCREAITGFDPERGVRLSTWLHCVLTNFFIQVCRKKHLPPLPGGLETQAPDPEPGEDPLWLRAELQRLAGQVLAQDPQGKEKALAFLLYHLHGWKFQRLGKRFGVAVSTVWKWVRQAQHAFASALCERYPTDLGAIYSLPATNRSPRHSHREEKRS